MNPLLKTAAKAAMPHLVSMTKGKKKKMLKHAGKWAAGKMVRRSSRASMGTMALRGLGVAALAVPVGIWVGRRLMERSES